MVKHFLVSIVLLTGFSFFPKLYAADAVHLFGEPTEEAALARIIHEKTNHLISAGTTAEGLEKLQNAVNNLERSYLIALISENIPVLLAVSSLIGLLAGTYALLNRIPIIHQLPAHVRIAAQARAADKINFEQSMRRQSRENKFKANGKHQPHTKPSFPIHQPKSR